MPSETLNPPELNQPELYVLIDAWRVSRPRWIGPPWESFCIKHNDQIAAIRKLQQLRLITTEAFQNETCVAITDKGFLFLPEEIRNQEVEDLDELLLALRKMHVAREGKAITLSEIGSAWGGRDPDSVRNRLTTLSKLGMSWSGDIDFKKDPSTLRIKLDETIFERTSVRQLLEERAKAHSIQLPRNRLTSATGPSSGDVGALKPIENPRIPPAEALATPKVVESSPKIDTKAEVSVSTPPTTKATDPQPAATGTASEKVENSPLGTYVALSRELDQERGLLVDQYAAAVATVLNESETGKNVAVLGPWGRGKTFLVKQVVGALKLVRKPYQTVWFSAWKYQSTPELWAHLYEVFSDASRQDGVFTGAKRGIRANIARHGHETLFVSLFLLAVAMLPLAQLIVKSFHYVIGTLGVLGTLRMLLIYRSAQKSILPRVLSFLSPVRHKDKLGLQAAIGDDLKALLQGWIRPQSVSRRVVLSYVGLILLVLACMLYGLGGYTGDNSVIPFFKLPSYPRPWVPIVAGTVWSSVAFSTLIWLAIPTKRIERILLVVDDLDRCSPGHTIEVIESLKLLLDEDEIQSRVQIIMIAEEHALRDAILKKYGAAQGRRDAVKERVFRDTMEKLFDAHLRLPHLQYGELSGLLQQFMLPKRFKLEKLSMRETELKKRMSELSAKRSIPNESQQIQSPTESADKPVQSPPLYSGNPIDHELATVEGSLKDIANERRRIEESSTPKSNSEAPAQSGPLLSEQEREALQKGLNLLTWDQDHPPGPRTLKNYLLRYQLARLLVSIRDVRVSPIQLTMAVAARMRDSSKLPPGPQSEIERTMKTLSSFERGVLEAVAAEVGYDSPVEMPS